MSATVAQRQGGFNLATGGTLVMPSNTASGNVMCVVALHSYAGCSPTLADSQSNTYTKHVNNANGANSRYFHVWSAPIGSSAACTLTFTCACGTVVNAFAAEVSGLSGTPYETSSTNAGSSTTITAGSVTPTVNGSYLMMLAASDSSTYTANTGFTKQFENVGYYAGDLVQGTAGAINPQCTVGGGPSYANGYVAVFQSAGGGGGGGLVARPWILG